MPACIPPQPRSQVRLPHAIYMLDIPSSFCHYCTVSANHLRSSPRFACVSHSSDNFRDPYSRLSIVYAPKSRFFGNVWYLLVISACCALPSARGYVRLSKYVRIMLQATVLHRKKPEYIQGNRKGDKYARTTARLGTENPGAKGEQEVNGECKNIRGGADMWEANLILKHKITIAVGILMTVTDDGTMGAHGTTV